LSEHFLIQLASILILGVGAQWLAWRLNLPSILILLLTGILAGPALGFLHPDELLGEILLPFVSISVAVILFEGGLSLKFSELRDVGKVVINLITIGAFITWILSTAAAYLILGLDFNLAVLLGGILVVTGPTVIIPMLHHIRPTTRVASALKWEGILIDPIGAVLAVLIFEVIVISDLESASTVVLSGLFKTVLIGTTIGILAAFFLYQLLLHYWLPDHLRNPLALMTVVAAHVTSNYFQHESGLLAVTIMGIALANQKKVTMHRIIDFKEDLSILLVSSLFILLAARIDANELLIVIWGVIPFLLLSVLFIRPLSVLVSTLGSGLSWQERLFVASMAPRGIIAASVSAIFALRLSEAGFAMAEMLAPITFIMIVGTVVIYGLTAAPLANWLGVAQANPQGVLIVGAHPWAREIARNIVEEDINVLLVDTNRRNVYNARMEGLPAYHGNIFSDYLLPEGIGKLLAITSNDECNSLATLNFGEIFGRANVFQLIPESGDKDYKPGYTPQHLRGRYLFRPEVTYRYLDQRFSHGSSLKKTQITEEFDFAAFQNRYGDSAIPMFLIDQAGNLKIFNADSPLTPKTGDTIISLIEKEKAEEKAQQHHLKRKKKLEQQEQKEEREDQNKPGKEALAG
jgi:NhaP-type Na+/H+ or K+/H+ antiporter